MAAPARPPTANGQLVLDSGRRSTRSAPHLSAAFGSHCLGRALQKKTPHSNSQHLRPRVTSRVSDEAHLGDLLRALPRDRLFVHSYQKNVSRWSSSDRRLSRKLPPPGPRWFPLVFHQYRRILFLLGSRLCRLTCSEPIPLSSTKAFVNLLLSLCKPRELPSPCLRQAYITIDLLWHAKAPPLHCSFNIFIVDISRLAPIMKGLRWLPAVQCWDVYLSHRLSG